MERGGRRDRNHTEKRTGRVTFFRKNLAWLVPLGNALVTSALLYFVYFYGTNTGLWFSSTVVPPWLFCAGWVTGSLVHRYPTRVGLEAYAVIIGLVTGILASYSVLLSLGWFTALGQPSGQPGFYLLNMIALSVTTLLQAMYRKYYELQDHFRQQNNAAALHKEAELFKLRQQLQPHFLYNSLNSVSALIMIQPDKAQEMIGKLSDFLRSSVRKEAGDRIPLEDEITYIRSYLAIESIRFGDRLQVHIGEHTTEGQFIPPFILQPILENAIKFSVYAHTGPVSIDVSLESSDNMLTLIITNPYDPDARPPGGTGFGLEGIRRRLYLLFSRSDLLETKQEDGRFTTILKIPQ